MRGEGLLHHSVTICCAPKHLKGHSVPPVSHPLGAPPVTVYIHLLTTELHQVK